MKIELTLINISEGKILERLLNEYLLEITGTGIKKYKYLDLYWKNKNRYPYFIKSDKEIVGFALVNNYILIQNKGMSISEFYIKKEFRKKGFGKEASNKIFDSFKGKWEVRQLKGNINGINFWRKVINMYTNGNYKEVCIDNEKWQGYAQVFDNS